MLKPHGDGDHERQHAWLAEAFATVVTEGFRLAEPVRTRHGAWSWEGWSATRWVEGAEPDVAIATTWVDIVEAGRAFHRAVAHLGRPDWLDARTHRWAVADRAAWGEQDVEVHPTLAPVARRLRMAVGPLGPPQLVHGDLTGNVLLAPDLPPAIIDVSPYWRPPAYADGVVVADALVWHGASPSLLDETGVSVSAVARALLFRLVTTSLATETGPARSHVEDEARRYERATRAIGT